MFTLTYGEREDLKRSRDPALIDVAHWHRFLEDVYGSREMFANIGPAIELPDDVKPTLKEYKQWKIKFPGWSYGPLTSRHPAWKIEYKSIKLPMNKYYEAK